VRTALARFRRMVHIRKRAKTMAIRFAILLLYIAVDSKAGLILDLSDPFQSVVPGGHGIYHGTLLNTDPVPYTIESFVLIAPPTDSLVPPTADQLFPILEPAVPFTIAAGDSFTGVILDIMAPLNAQNRNHPFGVEAASSAHNPDGTSIVSNTVLGELDVVPEP